MPRKVRVEYEGAIYHLMSRGDRRELFLGDADRELFLEQGPQHYEEELKESDEQKAEGFVGERCCARRGGRKGS